MLNNDFQRDFERDFERDLEGISFLAWKFQALNHGFLRIISMISPKKRKSE